MAKTTIPPPPYNTPPFDVTLRLDGAKPEASAAWSAAWLAWLNKIYGDCKLAEETVDAETFEPEPARDTESSVLDLVETSRDSAAGELRAEVDDLQSRLEALEAAGRPCPEDAEAPETARDWATEIEELRVGLALVAEAGAPVRGATIRFGTHAERLAAPLENLGDLWWETDRTAFYQTQSVAGVLVWIYLSGTYRDVHANIPVGLAAGDTGFLFFSTTYDHTFRWTGAAWGWAPGETKPGTLLHSSDAPGTGWHLCDGAAGVTRCKPAGDATTEVITVPDTSAGAYLKHGAYTGTAAAAVAPTISGSTESVSAGTPAGSFNGNALGTHTHDSPVTNNGTYFYEMNVNGTGGNYAASYRDSGITPDSTLVSALRVSANSAGTPSGSFVGNPMGTHSHGPGTFAVSATAEPLHLAAPLYMRL